MEERLSFAAALCGMEAADEILTALVEAATESLTSRLKEGVTPEDCGRAFPLAVAAVAAKAYEGGLGAGSVSEFTAGAVSLRLEQQAQGAAAAAIDLLRPWLRDGDFAFRGV